jgi:Bacterial type II/III secretion system short domain
VNRYPGGYYRRPLRAIGLTGLWLAAFLFVAFRSACSLADEPAAAPAVVAQPANGEAGKSNGRGRPGGEKPADSSKPEGQKAEGDQANADKEKPKEKDKDKDKEKAEATPPVHRPTDPAEPPNPAELKAQPDDQGRVSFSFKGQPWPAVLEWLADISHMSLDWQEAPGGFLDLTTRRKYSVEEARDMINSILLNKGYTLLRNGEVLIVASLKNLDVSLVPVVSPQELDELGSFELVRTYFDLDRLQAETMAEELKPLLGPYGKINALKTTNRIDVLETARTLRRIRQVIGAEQGESGKANQLREFKLVHARADDALASLKQLLGMQDKPAGGPMTPEQIQQQMQQQQQMMQQMQQQQKEKGGAPATQGQEPKIYLTINRRENSIMALATPDKLAVIEQAVKLLDVPVESSGSLMGNVQRVQIYRLVGADPGPIVNVLKEMGNLDPSTRLEVDNVNKAILVNGPLVDHLTVRTLIDKLDGSARRFEVIQLRKLDADYVAGSIEFLMRGAQKQDSRPRFFFDYGGGGRQQEPSKEGAFQVEADTKNNRLLLRANDIELDEIRKLMIKLGEDPFASTSGDNMRVIRSSPGRDTDELLERIKRVWPSISPAPLDVDPGGAGKSSAAPRKENDKKPEEEAPRKETPQRHETSSKPSTTAGGRIRTAQLVFAAEVQNAIDGDQREPAGTDGNEGVLNRLPADRSDAREMPFSSPQFGGDAAAGGRGPVSITRGPQGLIITSRDPAALDQMMKLINELSPTDSRFHVFTLKHTYARDVVTLLEKIFEDEDSKPKERGWSPFWFDNLDQPQEKKERNRLNKREPLKFVADSVTNSVLVQNADDEQLTQIRSLIDFYDRAEPPDSQSIRKTQIVAIQYSKAQQVADVVKDVYRDLLSPNDKALNSGQQRQDQQRPFYSFFDMGRSNQQGDNVPKFKGLLSIGIDASSNSLVVSAPQFLLTDVVNMIQKLDESTKPAEPVIRVMQVGGLATDPILKEALSNVADPGNAKHNAASQSRQDQNNQRNGRVGNNNNRGNRWNNNNNQGGGNNGGNNNNR